MVPSLFCTTSAAMLLSAAVCMGLQPSGTAAGHCQLSKLPSGLSLQGTVVDSLPVGSSSECCVLCGAYPACGGATFADFICTRYASGASAEPTVNGTQSAFIRPTKPSPRTLWALNETEANHAEVLPSAAVPGVGVFLAAAPPSVYVYNSTSGVLLSNLSAPQVDSDYYAPVTFADDVASGAFYIVSFSSGPVSAEQLTITRFANLSDSEGTSVAVCASAFVQCMADLPVTVTVQSSRFIVVPCGCGSSVSAVDPASGTVLWSMPVRPTASNSATVTVRLHPEDAALLVSTVDYDFVEYAFVDALTGIVLWRRSLNQTGQSPDERVESSAAVFASDGRSAITLDGILNYSDADNYTATMRLVDLATGQIVSSLALPTRHHCDITDAPPHNGSVLLLCKYFFVDNHPTLYLLRVSTTDMTVTANVTVFASYLDPDGMRRVGCFTSYDAATATLLIAPYQPVVLVAMDVSVAAPKSVWIVNTTEPNTNTNAGGNQVVAPLQPTSTMNVIARAAPGVFVVNFLYICCMGEIWTNGAVAYSALTME